MIKNIGVDIIENERFQSFLNNPRKLQRILSDLEIKELNKFTSESRKLEYIAGRFATKETLIKAGLQFKFSEVSILNHPNGKPYLLQASKDEVLITISHNRSMTVVVVVIIEPCFIN